MSSSSAGATGAVVLRVEVGHGVRLRGVAVVVDNLEVGRARVRRPLVVRPERDGGEPHDVWVRIDGIASNHVAVAPGADGLDVHLVAEVHAGWLVRFLEGFWGIEQQDPTVTLQARRS